MKNRSVRLESIGAPLLDHASETPAVAAGEVLIEVRSAGVCRSDVHYRSGASYAGPLPVVPGHEVMGVVRECGGETDAILADRGIDPGTRVAVHYLVTCGSCRYCMSGREQFCLSGRMIGKHRDGGFAEYMVIPARNLLRVPDSVSDDAAAIMMCSTATAFHAIRQARLAAGESIAIFGVGGLGMSAVQLARIAGARRVYAVDIDEARLDAARDLGAVPVRGGNAAEEALRSHEPAGLDCAVELLGLPQTIGQAVRILAPGGRLAIAGIADRPVEIDTYRDLVGREATIVGVSDHTIGELEYLLDLAASGALELDALVTDAVPLTAEAINMTLDRLEHYGPGVRTVVHPAATSPR